MNGSQPYRFRILTLFPDMIRQAISHSIVARAQTGDHIDVDATDIRDFTNDRHRTADDEPYGGGPGMVMKPEPVAGAIAAAKELMPDALVILMSASGRLFNQKTARRYSRHTGGLILICGHYEGVDERIAQHFCDEEICVGDYVLSGGELPALTVMDCTARLIKGVLGNEDSLDEESHNSSILESPQYTRPREFMSCRVPDILFSGDHAEIERFRHNLALEKTGRNRPDLIGSEPDQAGATEDIKDAADTRETNKPDNKSGGPVPAGWGRPTE